MKSSRGSVSLDSKRKSAGVRNTKTLCPSSMEDKIPETLDMKQEPTDEKEDKEESLENEETLSFDDKSNLTRVRSHERSLRAMANPSAVWAHFDLCMDDPLRAKCRICETVVVRGGANPRQCGTTNLHRHLRVHHGGRLIGRRYHGNL